MKVRLLLFIAIIISISTITAISFAQRTRDTADKPITGDFKITIKNTVAGNVSQSTTMIKGSRQRDISTLKTASAGKKLGGFLSKATGTGSGESGKSEAKLDFRLVPVDSTSPKLQSSASAKEETADASVNATLQEEARAVAGAVGGN